MPMNLQTVGRRGKAKAVRRISYREAIKNEGLRRSMVAEVNLFKGPNPPAAIVDLRHTIPCTSAHKFKYKPSAGDTKIVI